MLKLWWKWPSPLSGRIILSHLEKDDVASQTAQATELVVSMLSVNVHSSVHVGGHVVDSRMGSVWPHSAVMWDPPGGEEAHHGHADMPRQGQVKRGRFPGQREVNLWGSSQVSGSLSLSGNHRIIFCVYLPSTSDHLLSETPVYFILVYLGLA